MPLFTFIKNSALKITILIAFLFLIPKGICAQTYLETYGQNRIQTRKFVWKVFESDHFRVYHYDRSGKDLARYVVEQAESNVATIEKISKTKMNEKFNIILYNSYEEYRQTNVGRSQDALLARSTQSGSVNMIDDKMVLYFSGVHTDLKKQIEQGISKILLERKIKSGSVSQMALNSAKVNIPEWLQEGYVAYTADGWNEQTDKAWKALVEANAKKKFYDLSQINGSLSGQAFWKYIKERYGNKEVKDLMNAMKSKGNMNKALKAKYQLNVVKVFDSCLAFYKDAFVRDAADKKVPNTAKALVKIPMPKDNTEIRNIKVSPRGSDVAYVKWKEGQFQVALKHTNGEQEESIILEGGEKNYAETSDPNYPLMAWSNTGYQLAILYQKGNQIRLRIYDATKGKMATYVIPNNRFDRALGMAIDEDNNGIILSAIRKSQTDLYYFTIKGARMRNLTNDVWDDVQPAFVTGGQKRGIMFLSNRPKANMNVPAAPNELPTGPMNVFFYNTTTKRQELFQCSNAEPNTIISQPIQFGPDNFAYIANTNGTRNKYVVVFGRDQYNKDSAYFAPATNLAYNLNSHQYNPAGNLVADVVLQDGFYTVYTAPFLIPDKDVPSEKVQTALLVEEEQSRIGLSPTNKNEKKWSSKPSNGGSFSNSGVINLKGGNDFQTEFDNDKSIAKTENEIAETEPETANEEAEEVSIATVDSTFIKMRARPYKVGFRPNAFSVSLDNNILFNRYQPASQNGNQFANPSLGGLITMSMDDMMEDYRITGGFKLPFGNQGSTYFVQFENAKRRLDWNVALMRNANSQAYNLLFTDTLGNPVLSTIAIGKTVSTLVQGTGSYPIDRMRSLRFQLGLRQDVLNFKAIDTFTLIATPDKKYWTMSRAEFVFDNTKFIETNIRQGTRYKVFAEYMYQMNNKGGGLYNFGFDFRNYQKIYKNMIWAFRTAAAHSGGQQKILYFLGGVDNWMNYQQANPAAPVNQESYGFQTQANNLRGYNQNARNGNSYAVMNNEFRLPLLTTFIRRPIQSKILRSLQLVAFNDIGLAWNGLFPNDNTMSKNQVLGQNPVTVSVNVSGVDGVAMGYGLGMRAAVSGYQLRLDAAWNKEGNTTTPILYFSIGTDF